MNRGPGLATRAVQAVLGTRPVCAAFRAATGSRLRVLAYHGIGNAGRFEAQLVYLSRHYSVVDSAQVLRWLHDGEVLPRRAVWLTFDDGIEDVVNIGLPLLQRHQVRATLFICPSLIDTDKLHWWRAVERADVLGLLDDPAPGVLRRLKAGTDAQRRVAMVDIEHALRPALEHGIGRQLTSDQLRDWLAAGNDLGNHSFDHPLLDQCDPAEQERQVSAAHEWLADFVGTPPTLFAWPNGNPSDAALTALRSLAYRAVLLHDHRLCAEHPDALALSRLRIDADASLGRMRSIVSGAHPTVFGIQRRLRLMRRGGGLR